MFYDVEGTRLHGDLVLCGKPPSTPSCAGGSVYTRPIPHPPDVHLAGTGNDVRANAPRVAFRLRLYGKVPVGQTFHVVYSAPGSDDLSIALFCGSDSRGFTRGVCTGGRSYTREPFFVRGDAIEFRFVRASHPGGLETFHHGIIVVGGRRTISAYYSFPDRGQLPCRMPGAGAGGCCDYQEERGDGAG